MRRPRVYTLGGVESAPNYGKGWRKDLTDKYPEIEFVHPGSLMKHDNPQSFWDLIVSTWRQLPRAIEHPYISVLRQMSTCDYIWAYVNKFYGKGSRGESAVNRVLKIPMVIEHDPWGYRIKDHNLPIVPLAVALDPDKLAEAILAHYRSNQEVSG